MTIRTCLSEDPETKGGSEATVRIAKVDLVPKDVNLLEKYRNFAALESACRTFCEDVNNRVHRETKRRPVEMLPEKRTRLTRCPSNPSPSRSAPPGGSCLALTRPKGAVTLLGG